MRDCGLEVVGIWLYCVLCQEVFESSNRAIKPMRWPLEWPGASRGLRSEQPCDTRQLAGAQGTRMNGARCAARVHFMFIIHSLLVEWGWIWQAIGVTYRCTLPSLATAAAGMRHSCFASACLATQHVVRALSFATLNASRSCHAAALRLPLLLWQLAEAGTAHQRAGLPLLPPRAASRGGHVNCCVLHCLQQLQAPRD